MVYLPYELFMNGSYVDAPMQVYDLAMGGEGLFFVLLYFMLIVIISLVTESPATIGVFTFLGGLIFYSLIPMAYHDIFYIITVFALAITLFKVFIHKRGAIV